MLSADGVPQGSCRANLISRFRLLWLLVLAMFGGRYLNTMLAIRRKDTVETGEIDSWPGRQSGRPGNKGLAIKSGGSKRTWVAPLG